MKRLISYPISFIVLTCFLVTMSIFNPIQWICFNFFGYQAHKKSIDVLNFFLVRYGHIMFNTYQIDGRELIPKGKPLIFVSNHQSLYDVVVYLWFFREFHPKFVSKIELGSGVPSVSYNLRHGGSILIDRKNPKQAIPLVKGLSEYIEKHKRSAVIFPEGTRSQFGDPKPFAESGLKILCKYAPSAYVVPITINNSWKILSQGLFPLGLGSAVQFKVHEPLAVADYTFEEIFKKTHEVIIKDIKI